MGDPQALHAALLAKIGEYITSADADEYPVLAPLMALRAVVELHKPHAQHWDDDRCATCATCFNAMEEYADWPCSTIRAVAGELGVDLTWLINPSRTNR